MHPFLRALVGGRVGNSETANDVVTSRRMQFLADHPAKRGINLLAGHGLVERVIDEGLVAASRPWP